MKIAVCSIYSPPEKTGIGKYNGELAEHLSQRGHEVYYLTTMPFYPEWNVHSEFRRKILAKKQTNRLTIRRIWSYTPGRVNSVTRILKELHFYLNSFVWLLAKAVSGYRPDVIIFVAPPFFLPSLLNFIFPKAKTIYHIQDLEVDAAIGLNMLPAFLAKSLLRFELMILNRMSLVSTISEGMIKKILEKGYEKNVFLFPNWTSESKIFPKPSQWLHLHLALPTDKKLIVYSGNIGNKQGFEILPHVMQSICEQFNDVHFVILGEGVFKNELIELLQAVPDQFYTIGGLVDSERLNDMLNSSYMQLVIQKSEGSDSFMPSKLTNILAAGIPAVVTARAGTGLHQGLSEHECAVLTDDNSESLGTGIKLLLTDTALKEKLKSAGRVFANKHLSSEKIFSSFEDKLQKLSR